MDALIQPVSDALGAPVDQLKYLLCTILSYPLGSLFIRIPSSQIAFKHAFSVVVTSFLLIFVLRLPGSTLQVALSTLGTYIIARTVQTKNMPWIVFAFTMGHLWINHVFYFIWRSNHPGAVHPVDITAMQMVLTMKLITFAWNVYDGRRPLQDLDKWQAANRITKFPSLLEMFGFAFFFPAFMAGPSLEYSSYLSVVDGSLFAKIERNEKSVALKRGMPVPSGRKRIAYRKLLEAIVYFVVYAFGGAQFNYHAALRPWFSTTSLWYRIGYMLVCGLVERTKYYGAWTLAEGACILTGFGFSGYDAKTGASLWNAAANVDIRNIELAPNFKVLLDSWNMKTNTWLRECVYKRVTPRGTKPGFSSTMITFGTSAFWHGVAGGYYLTFFLAGFVQTAGRLCRSHIRPLFFKPAPATRPEDVAPSAPTPNGTAPKPTLPPPVPTSLKPMYDAVGTLCTLMILNFTVPPFVILNVGDSLRAWHALGWYGAWMTGAVLVFFWAGGARYLRAFGKNTGASSSKNMPATPGETPKTNMQVLPVDLK